MKAKQIVLSLVAAALLLFAARPAAAHHSFAMFDMSKDVTITGVVVEYRWENPHSHIIIKVAPGAKDPSTVGTWDVEGASINIMGRQGWNRITYKAGDPVTVVAHPMKDGSKGLSLFYAIRPDGSRLYQDIARPKPGESAQQSGH
jgi:Family of unknown function (DUF6152)